MAKRKTSGVRVVSSGSKGSAPIIVTAPASPVRRRSGGGRRRAPRRSRARVGAAMSRARALAMQHRHQAVAIASGAALGFAEKQGVNIPRLIPGLSTPANLGIVAWGVAKLMPKSAIAPYLNDGATGLLSIAAYEFGRGRVVSGDVMGDVMGAAVVYDDLDGDLEGDDDDGDD